MSSNISTRILATERKWVCNLPTVDNIMHLHSNNSIQKSNPEFCVTTMPRTTHRDTMNTSCMRQSRHSLLGHLRWVPPAWKALSNVLSRESNDGQCVPLFSFWTRWYFLPTLPPLYNCHGLNDGSLLPWGGGPRVLQPQVCILVAVIQF